MIINDFELIFFLNKEINVFILLNDSLRSYVIFNIIKYFYKKKCFWIDLNTSTNLDFLKHTNSILVFKNISHDLISKMVMNDFFLKKNIIIFFLKEITYKFSLKKIIISIKKNTIIIKFNDLNNTEKKLWLRQFFLYKSFYLNYKVCSYLVSFLNDDLEHLIIKFSSNINKKLSLLEIILNNNISSNKIDFLLNLYRNDYEISLYTYKKSINYTNLLKNYNSFKKNKEIILYLLIILDLNIKYNNLFLLNLILFNFIMNMFFEKKNKDNNFDKFNIKYITKK